MPSKNSASMKERYIYLKRNCRCVQCGGKDERTRGGKVVCASCAAKQRECARNRYDRLRASGLCTHCGKVPVGAGKVYCAGCAQKRNKYEKERYYRKKKELAEKSVARQ